MRQRLISFEVLEDRYVLSTNMIAELNPFGAHGDPFKFVSAGDHVFFSAVNGNDERHLWASDGTSEGTRELTAIPLDIREDDIFQFGDRVLAWRGTTKYAYTRELWISDGTEAGTVLLKTAVNQDDFSGLLVAEHGAVYGDHFYWPLKSGALWRTDGTVAGTSMVDAAGVEVHGVYAVSDRLLINTAEGVWSLDELTSTATPLLPDLKITCAHEFDGVWLICKDGRLTVQKQLRLLDPNTLELSDFSLPFYYPDVLVVHDDHFAVVDRHQVMVSDGSSTGTTTWELGDIDGHTVFHDGLLVANGVHGVGTTLYLVPFDGAPMETVVELDDDYVPRLTFDGELAFFGNTLPDRSTEAWVTDGTAAGTRLLRKLDSGDLLGGSRAGEFTVFLDRVVFSAATGTHGREAWITDGTAAGTELLIETNPNSGGSYPENWMQLGGETYFFAEDGTGRYTKELWKTDGTASGTQRTGAELRGDFDAEDIRIHNDIAYLMSHSSFWITDGTPDGTRQVGHDVDHFGTSAHIFLGDDLITAGAAYDNADRHLRLFSYDVNQDTVTPINLNQDISVSRVEFFEFENDLYIFNQTDSLDLWKFDTASQEVSQVKQIRSGPMVSNPVYDFVTDIVTVGDAFYFVADNGETGAEVWRSDGTPDGTALLRDLYEGEISSYPRYLTEFQGELFFQGCGAEHGTELWRSDGTAEGTRLVIDIQPGPRGSHPGQLTVYGDELLFAADDGASGFELWKSDGTAEGTERVEDIRPGEEGAHPWLFTLFQDKLYFLADDGRSGREFWHYDSETQQVALGAETIVGPEFAWPSQIFATDQAMFFRGNSPTYGREPWVYRGDQLWFDSSFPADVDGNEVVSPLDALTVITELTLREFSSVVDGAIRVNITPTGRADVNNDGFISPLDALLVINQLPSTAASAMGHPTSDPIVYFTQQHIDDVWAQDEEEHADLFE